MKQDLSFDVSGFNDNDPIPFKTIYDRHHRKLYALSVAITEDDATSEDLISEAYVKIWEKPDKDFETEANILSYLWITVRNKSVDFVRWRKGAGFTREVDEGDAIDQATLSFHETTVSIMDFLYSLIEDLPQGRKQIIKMRFLQNMTRKEVAAALNISVLTVKRQELDALKSLRKDVLSGGWLPYLILLVIFFNCWRN